MARANTERDAHRWGEAALLYEAAIEQAPMADHLRVQLGHCLKESGRFEAAFEQYGKFRAAHPDDIDVHLQIGHLFNRQRAFAEAAAWYRDALRLSREQPQSGAGARATLQTEVRRSLAQVLASAGEWAPALDALLELVFEDRQLDLLGKLLEMVEHADRGAVSGRLPAVGDWPQDAGRQLVAGEVRLRIGQPSEALRHLIAARGILLDLSSWAASLGQVEALIAECKSTMVCRLQ